MTARTNVNFNRFVFLQTRLLNVRVLLHRFQARVHDEEESGWPKVDWVRKKHHSVHFITHQSFAFY